MRYLHLMPVLSGIDVIVKETPAWKSSRIGMVTNQAASTADGIPSRKALLDAGFHIQVLFSPEHGLDVKGADGHFMADDTDVVTGLKIVSLYGDKLAPDEKDISVLDCVLFDVPDVGSRFYTYLWTLTHVIEACAKARIPLIILDRPNPVSGILSLAEGPMLDASQSSFIGRWPMPIRHSCTLGELAKYFNQIRQINVNLTVIECLNWKRDQFFPDWQLPFVPTSPAIRSYESMLLYPGLCLLEATNTSEGRGTNYSFTSVGAPWINGAELAQKITALFPDELHCEAISFTPDDVHVKFNGQQCEGVRFTVTDPLGFRPVFFGILLIRILKEMYPRHFEWKPYVTMVNPTGEQHLDKLLGIPGNEQMMELPFREFIAMAAKITDCRNWEKEIGPYLLY
jgi:uncharacterized protein YbbC (DUF1343 family)